MKNIKNIFKLLFLKFTFKPPSKSDIIVFDNVSSKEFKYALSDLKYFTLNVRQEEIKIIYISWQIILLSLKNIFYGIKISYMMALIKSISPKLIITLEDNSLEFSKLAKILNNKYIFIAVQNSARYFGQYRKLFEKNILKKNPNNSLYLPNYFCFGDHEVNETKKENIKVKNYFPVGLLRLSNYLQFKLEQNIDKINIKYDFALICEMLEQKKNLWKSEKLAEDYMKIFQYSIRAALKNKLKVIFILKSKNNREKELNFYKKYLNANEIKFLMNNIVEVDRENYKSYIAIEKSKVAIAFHSTMLLEKLGLNGKVLSCNFTDEDVFNFPVDCLFRLIRPSYEDFETRLLKIIKLEDEKYIKNIKKKLISNHQEHTHKIINDRIKNLLNEIKI